MKIAKMREKMRQMAASANLRAEAGVGEFEICGERGL
jgi:hypothetical protein